VAEWDKILVSIVEPDTPYFLDPAGLLYELLSAISDHAASRVFQLRDKVAQLQEVIHDEPDVVDSEMIYEMKRDSMRAGIVIEDQQICVKGLLRGELTQEGIQKRKDYFYDLQMSLDIGFRSSQRLKDRLEDLEHQLSIHLQSRSENRLRTLTILAAIFTPLTLIAGIYGMNFANMPELQWKYGYVAVLGLMLVVAAVLLLYFKRKRWFE
jgi:magnesium transporter